MPPPPTPQRKPDPVSTPATVPSRVGATLGKCRLLKPIGSGGMGDVYLAEHTLLQRKVAIKILPPEMTRDADLLARFHREAVATARLDHPNIVSIMDVGVHNGTHYIMMQYVQGRSLQKVLDDLDGPMDLKEAARIIAAAARGLQAAHDGGIVHRDIKPANILISDRGEVKITDFGVAHDEGGPALTAPGEAMGTPHFMSPEQSQGKATDARSDIYSLGVTLYACVTGHRPFSGENHMAILYKQIHEEPLAPKKLNTMIPDALSRLTLRMMAKAPEQRYATCSEVASDLEQFVKGTLKTANPVGSSSQHGGMRADSKVLRQSAMKVDSKLLRNPGLRADSKVLRAKGSPTTGPVPRTSDRRMVIGVAAAFAIAAVGLVIWATAGKSRDPKPSPVVSGTASPAPDRRQEKYRSLLARASELEAASPEAARMLYLDAAAEWPEGPEAKEALERLSRKEPDEEAWAELTAFDRKGTDPAEAASRYRAFLTRFPGSPRAAEARARLDPMRTGSPTPDVAPSLEPGFEWLALSREEFDRKMETHGVPTRAAVGGHLAELENGTAKKIVFTTKVRDVADFVLRFQVRIDRGTVTVGGRLPLGLAPTYNGYKLEDPTPDGKWVEIELAIIGGEMTLLRSGGLKDTNRKLKHNSGCVFFELAPDSKVALRYPRLAVLRREAPKVEATPSASPAPPAPFEPPGDAELLKIFGDGRELAARDYDPVIKRLKARVDEADGELQSHLRVNLARIEMARDVAEKALATLSERVGRDLTLKTRDGQKHALRLKRADAREIEGLRATDGGILVLKTANLHADTIVELATKMSDLDLIGFLLTEGDAAGAVKRLFAEARKLKPGAPLEPAIDHLISMDLLGQLKDGPGDLRTLAERLEAAGETVDRLRQHLVATKADAVRRTALALAERNRHRDAIAHYIEWAKTSPAPASLDAVAGDLYPVFMAEGWKKYWTEGDVAAAFDVVKGEDGSVKVSGREMTLDSPERAMSLKMRASSVELSGLALEVRILRFRKDHGFNLRFSGSEDGDAGLFSFFDKVCRVDIRIGSNTFKAVALNEKWGNPVNRWLEMSVFTLGPHDYFFIDGALLHRGDAGMIKIAQGCGVIVEELTAMVRNVRVRVAK